MSRPVAPRHTRGQANLAAVALALVVLSGVTVGTVFVADSALVSATRDADDARLAASLADRLLATEPTSHRPDVLSEVRLRNLSAADLSALAPAVSDAAVEVRLDGETVFRQGDPTSGAAVTRAALSGRPRSRQLGIDLSDRRETTLPHRTRSVSIAVDTENNTTVETVRVNDRVVLHNTSGLDGEATFTTADGTRPRLAFETNVTATNASTNVTSPPNGTVGIRYDYLAVEGTTLEVVVDA